MRQDAVRRRRGMAQPVSDQDCSRLRVDTQTSPGRDGMSVRGMVLTDGLDFGEERSRTSSKDRSESSEKLRFWLAFRSGEESRD